MKTAPDRETKTVYITKYFETIGIIQVKAEIFNSEGGRPFVSWGTYSYAHGSDWHESLAEARLHVAKQLKTRIASAEAKLKKLKLIDPSKMPAVK